MRTQRWFARLAQWGILAVLAAGLLVAGARTVFLESQQVAAQESLQGTVPEGAVERLSNVVQYRTVTKRDPAALDSTAYHDLYKYLTSAYPTVHERLDTTHVNGISRLYTWPGSDTTKAPIVLMAHVDVVPVEPGTEGDWRHPPYSGAVADDAIWGRGTLDDKASAVGILEAISSLLDAGVHPDRTVHVALGHDEEVGGPRGAKAIAERLTEDGSRPALVIDEGGAITKGALPGLDRPLALVGIAEKGYLSVELEAEAPGGHSSAPPDSTSIRILNVALKRLLDNPLPARLDGVMGQTLKFVAPEMDAPMRFALANQWLTGPVLKWALSRTTATEAAMRTVQVPTQLDAGVKDNVIPSTARATINYRIVPSQSVSDVRAYIESTVEDLPITIELGQASEPTSVSTVEDTSFRVVQRTIREVTADSTIVAPYLVPGATDSRHYADASNHVYRFLPFTLTPDDRGLIHGTNEHISVKDFERIIQFYIQLLHNLEALPAEVETDA